MKIFGGVYDIIFLWDEISFYNFILILEEWVENIKEEKFNVKVYKGILCLG